MSARNDMDTIMDKLDKLLITYQKKHGLGKNLIAARIVDGANSIADGRYRAVSFRDGRLKVEAPAGPELFFLKRDEPNIILEINKKLGQEIVQDLVLRGV